MESSQRFAEVLRESAERQRRRQAEELREQYIRIFSGIYDRAAAYTRILITVGYAATFAVWAFVRDEMTSRQQAASGLLLLASVSVFVLWEVWSNIGSVAIMRKLSQALLRDPPDALAGMEEYEKAQREKGLRSVRSWAITVVFSLATGATALGIMVWSLARQLVEAIR